MEMDRYWFFTWRTYGTWLPGEEGFVGKYVTKDGQRVTDNRHGDLAGPAMPALAGYAAEQMTHPPVYLTHPQAERLLDQFHETARYRGRVIDAVAILSNHIHMVFGTPGDPNPDELLEDWKVYASRALNRLIGWAPPNPRPVWWARGGSKRITKTVARRAGAIRYIQDQETPLVLWLSDEATQLLATYPDEAWADALGEPRP
jgi:REP element-mobilizing transposase RayT